MDRLQRVKLEGFKSIRQLDLQLHPLTILIGANGAGKSNFVSFFRMLNFAMSRNLQEWIGREGGANSLLYYGAKTTPQMIAEIEFTTDEGLQVYYMRLVHVAPDTLIFADEAIAFTPQISSRRAPLRHLGSGHKEMKLTEVPEDHDQIMNVARDLMSNWLFYQFHDTSAKADIRQHHYIEDNRSLKPDAGNLGPFLYMLKRTKLDYYQRIISTIRLIAPFFGDFVLEPMELDPAQIILNWQERGSDVLFGPHQLSDGTLRMMALVTLLLQPPEKLPSLIVIDEPELGLHPYAINVLASLIKGISEQTQVIVSTQSVGLIDNFEPEDIVVVDRPEQESIFTRLDAASLDEWLAEYSLSELWEKNVIGGRP